MGVAPTNAPRARARIGLSRTVWLSLLLVAVIIVAAGFAGAAHLGGARFSVRRSDGGQAPGSAGQSQPGQPDHLKGLPVLHPPARLAVWAAIAILVVALLGVGWLIARLVRRRRRGRAGLPTPTAVQTPWWKVAEPEADPDALVTGIEFAVRALEQSHEPTDAIVRAWLGLEATAEESGVLRRAAETPTEFTRRVMQRAFADDRAVQTLLRLYLRTRFGDHPPTAADVAAVREALAQLVSSWRSSAPAAAGSERRRAAGPEWVR